MGNIIQIKHGSTIPTINNLSPYELGYVHNGELYINNNGIIVQLTGKLDENLNGLIKDGNLTISQFEVINKSEIKQDKILVTNGNNQLLYRTPEEILLDINGFSIDGGEIKGNVNIIKNLSISGQSVFDGESIFNNITQVNSSFMANGAIILKEGINYGYQDPNEANIPGVKGQIYFLLT